MDADGARIRDEGVDYNYVQVVSSEGLRLLALAGIAFDHEPVAVIDALRACLRLGKDDEDGE